MSAAFLTASAARPDTQLHEQIMSERGRPGATELDLGRPVTQDAVPKGQALVSGLHHFT